MLDACFCWFLSALIWEMSSELRRWCAWGNQIDGRTVFLTPPVPVPLLLHCCDWSQSRPSSNRWQKVTRQCVSGHSSAPLWGPDPGQTVWRRARWKSELSPPPTCSEQRMSSHVFIGEEFNPRLRGEMQLLSWLKRSDLSTGRAEMYIHSRKLFFCVVIIGHLLNVNWKVNVMVIVIVRSFIVYCVIMFSLFRAVCMWFDFGNDGMTLESSYERYVWWLLRNSY